MPLIDPWGEDPTANPAVLHHLRALACATQQLWRDLRISPPVLVPGHVQHSKRVALFSLKIARVLGLKEELSHQIFRAAYLHDVGKIAVPARVIHKEGAFSAQDRRAMQVHSVIGRELLRALLPTRDLAGIALAHHERYDGEGYPNGLRGTKIPLSARVLAIADSLEDMLSRSTGRTTRSYAAAWAEIDSQAGRQFDPTIVNALVRHRAMSTHRPDSILRGFDAY